MKIFRHKKVQDTDSLKDIEKNENDKCLLCGCDTEYKRYVPITERLYYVIGCGQLCESCYQSVYKKGE